MIVEITIRDNETGNYYRIPVLPESIAYNDGDAIKDTVKIIDLGNVDFASGIDLDSMEWSSFFPAKYDSGYCSTADLLEPIQYRNLFSTWKDSSRSLQVVCPAAGISKNMLLYNFKWELKGFAGDIYYSVSLKERKVIKPVQITVGANIQSKPKSGATSRQAIPQKLKANTYTVKAGDTLSLIAKKLNISNWHTLYERNKATIGSNPSVIRPGQVLTV